jgi:hypothetical protein
MKITSYGLFWQEMRFCGSPVAAIVTAFGCWDDLGPNRPNIKIADFRHQQGIYILFDGYGPSYVGLTRKQGLRKRLKDHTMDHLKDGWDRFSWFGFNEIGAPKSMALAKCLPWKMRLARALKPPLATWKPF